MTRKLKRIVFWLLIIVGGTVIVYLVFLNSSLLLPVSTSNRKHIAEDKLNIEETKVEQTNQEQVIDNPSSKTTACSINGNVENAKGMPMEGALVSAHFSQPKFPYKQVEISPVSSDKLGQFSILDIACESFTVTATAKTLGSSQNERVELTEDNPNIRIRLILKQYDYRLSGTVNDRGSGPIVEAIVQAVRISTGASTGGSFSTKTNQHGEYELVLDGGNYLVSALAESYAPAQRRVVINRNHKEHFRLDPAGVIRGLVIRQDNKKPVSNATVFAMATNIMNRGGFFTPSVTLSKSDGTFELGGLTSGKYNLIARQDRLRGEFSGQVPVNIAGVNSDIVIEVSKGQAIFGRVVGENKKPIAGAHISWSSFGPSAGIKTSSSNDGKFVLTGMGFGTGRLFAFHRGYLMAKEQVTVGNDDIHGIILTLRFGVRIIGKVVDQNGSAISGAIVTAMTSSRHGNFINRKNSQTSNKNGEFVFEIIKPGDITIQARHLVEGGIASEMLKDAKPGNEYQVSLIMSQGSAVSGSVKWADGKPAIGAFVRAFLSDQGPPIRMGEIQTETDENGEYILSGLREGRYLMWSLRPNTKRLIYFPSHDTKIELKPKEHRRDVNFTLELADKIISGLVIDESGAPVADAEVGAHLLPKDSNLQTFHPLYNSQSFTLSEMDGSFELQGLTAGTYKIWAELPGLPRGITENIESGAYNVVVNIPPGATLAGLVFGPNNKPAIVFELHTIPTSKNNRRMVRWPSSDRLKISNPQGAFEVNGLQAGTYRLVARTPGNLVGEISAVNLDVAQRKENLRIELTGGQIAKGRVIGYPSQTPVANTKLSIFTDAGSKQVTTDENGLFHAEGLVSGMVHVSIMTDNKRYLSDGYVVVLQQGETKALELYLLEVAAVPKNKAIPPILVKPMAGKFSVVPKEGKLNSQITAGDLLVAIDNVKLNGFGHNGVRSLLKGNKGTKVTLNLIKNKTGENYSLTITRDELGNPYYY